MSTTKTKSTKPRIQKKPTDPAIVPISSVLPQSAPKRRGRPTGTKNQTFIPVALSTLNRILGADSVVMVSKKYVDLIMVNNITPLPSDTKPTLPAVESPSVTVTEFSENDPAGLSETAVA